MRSTDTNRNIVAALSYFLFFITGIVILLVEKDDKFIRFHATQSIFVFGFLFALNFIVQVILYDIAIIGALASVFGSILFIAGLVIWLVSMIRAYQGYMYKWPIVGNLAENRVK